MWVVVTGNHIIFKMNGVIRASSLAPYLSATTHTVPSVTRPVIVEFPKKVADVVSQGRPLLNSNYSMSQVFLPKTRAWVNTKATFGLTSTYYLLFEAYKQLLLVVFGYRCC